MEWDIGYKASDMVSYYRTYYIEAIVNAANIIL